jgi:membrane protein YqaA with SNARE-associated domain
MKNKWIAILLFFSSIALSLAFFAYRDFFKEALSLGLLGLLILNFISSAGFFVSAPTILTVLAAGSIYPPVLVAVVSALGASLGDMLGYMFGYSGRHLAMKKFDKYAIVRYSEEKFNKHGDLIILLFAIVPNPFFDAIGILAGAVKFSPSRFFVIMLIGRFLRFWLLAKLGTRI